MDIRKNKERVQELKVLWKNEKLHSTINKYIEILTFTRLQACCSQIVTFKILNSSLRFDVDRHFLYGFSFHHELDSFQGNEGVYLLVIEILCPPQMVVRCFRIPLWRKVQRQTICSNSIQSRSAKYLLWPARTSGANVFGHFLFVYFLY